MSAARSLSQVGLFIGLGLLGYVGLTTLSSDAATGDVDDNVMAISTENAAMQEAEAAALATLPQFLEHYEAPPTGWQSMMLKVGLQGTDMVENIWVSDISRVSETSFTGYLANEPVGLEGLHHGSKVVFETGNITDWSVIVQGRGYGFYSVRAMVGMASPEDAAQMLAFLSEDPLPPAF